MNSEMRLRFSSITEYVLKIWFLNSDLKHLIAAIKKMANPISFLYHIEKDIIVNGV